jgi:hypothetical protein
MSSSNPLTSLVNPKLGLRHGSARGHTHSSSDEDQLAARGQVIGVYGHGNVEQNQASLKDGWQVDQILRKIGVGVWL